MEDWRNSLVRAQQGDLTAFDAVVKQFQDMAVGYAYSILHDFQLAEDAAQEAFIQAYIDRTMLREPLAFPAWLRKLVFKQCDRITRRKKVITTPFDDTVNLQDASPTPLEVVEQRETQDMVLSAVDTLPKDQRIVATLFYINGYSLSEVGKFLDVPAITVKSRLHSARAKLRDRMIGLVRETLKQKAPGEDFRRRVHSILEGITQFSWESTWLCFEGSLYGCLKYIDKEIDLTHLMGISGGAFKFLWHPESSPAMCDLSLLGEEPIRRICNALGYSYTYDEDRYKTLLEGYSYNYNEDECAASVVGGRFDGLKRDPKHTKEFYTDKIVKSIDAGRPVLARGIFPQFEDCETVLEYSVITGYDKNGKVLYGASYFQLFSKDQDAYFREEDWYDRCFGVITIGDRHEPPSELEILTDALTWAIDLSRTPRRNTTMPTRVGSETWHYSGLAAYDALADALIDHIELPNDDKVLFDDMERFMFDGIWLLLQERENASLFLRQMASYGLPGTELIQMAADLYSKEVDILRSSAEFLPFSPPQLKCHLISDKSVRQELYRIVQAAKVEEEHAIQQLELAQQELSRKQKEFAT